MNRTNRTGRCEATCVALYGSLTLVGILGSGLCVATDEGVRGGEPNVTERDVIVAVDVQALVHSVFPEFVRAPIPVSFNEIGVRYVYRRASGGEDELRIVLGIYDNAEAARQAAFRTMPSAPFGARVDSDCPDFYSSGAYHIRCTNAFLMISQTESLWAPCDSHVLRSQESQEARAMLAKSVERALYDPAVVTMGSSVDTPELKVLNVMRVLPHGAETAERDMGYNIVLRCTEDDELLFPEGRDVCRVRRLEDGRYEVAGRRHPFYGDMSIRAARPTGEVVVLDVEEMVKLTTKVGPSWVERERAAEEARRRKEQHGLSDAERNDIIARLRRREGNDFEQGQMVRRLANERAKESVPVLVEVLQSDRAATVKALALDGLRSIEGKDGVGHFRAVALDRSQPESIRARSVKLVGEFGVMEDRRLLQRIAREEGLDVPSPYAVGDEITKLKQNRFDGRDILLHELWEAGRRLEARIKDD